MQIDHGLCGGEICQQFVLTLKCLSYRTMMMDEDTIGMIDVLLNEKKVSDLFER